MHQYTNKLACLSLVAGTVALTSCGSKESAGGSTSGGYDAATVAEVIYTVLKADRTVYASKVVNRLVKDEKVIKAHEEWQQEKALLLPAQFFREGAELVDKADKPVDFSYSLQSTWPLNYENAKKKTEAVEAGLKAISTPGDPAFGKKWTGEETIGDQKYFIGIYPDKAVAPACWTCHNEHENRKPEYPEFKKNDVMGGIVIRIPINS